MPLEAVSAVLLGAAALGIIAGVGWALAQRIRPRQGVSGVVAMQRAASYAGLAVVLAVAAQAGVAGIAVLAAALGAVGLTEWSRLTDLPIHHRIALQLANLAIVGAVAIGGTAGIEWLVGALVLVGIAWPVVRADPGRALRDLGLAAVGCVILPVLLVHGVLLAVERGDFGITLFVAIAVACAVSDVGAFIVGRRLGRTPLAPRLSPAKTREGVIGNVLGAAAGFAAFVPLLQPALTPFGVVVIVGLVAIGAVWGDLFESAVKREAGVKDAGAWLPGFGGILDRIDSLLVAVPLVYWSLRIGELVT